MGKHNGKARSAGTGAKPGGALLNSQARSARCWGRGVRSGAAAPQSGRSGALELRQRALTPRRPQSNSKKQEWAAYRHTTHLQKDTGMQSVIEQNDLSEFMNMVRRRRPPQFRGAS